MASFLLSKNASDDLETIVFKLGDEESADEGIPVFTSKERAYDWLEGSQYEAEYEIVQLEDLHFLFWCTDVCQDGVGFLILDPDRQAQETGQGQNTIDLAGHLAFSATQIMTAHQKAA